MQRLSERSGLAVILSSTATQLLNKNPGPKVLWIVFQMDLGLPKRQIAGKRQPFMVEAHRNLYQLDQVDHVGEVVEGQLHQGRPVAAPVAAPQPDGLEAVHTLNCGVTGEPQASLDGLQPAPVAQRAQHEPQVDVGLIQPGLGKMHPQERHVELAAVERDQERELAT